MSKRIEQILEVVEEVRDNFLTATRSQPISRLRIQALTSVAIRRGIDPTTVSTKYRRELKPEIDRTPDFNQKLEDWLVRGSGELASIIRLHTSDQDDFELIDAVFTDATLELGEDVISRAAESPFTEGRALLRLHLTRERNRWLVALAKEKWRQEQGGEPCCVVCGFSFAQAYGNVGRGFIEAHHVRPISSMEPNTQVTVDDLVPVCSNCHSVLHRYEPWPTVQELRSVVSGDSASLLRT